MNGSTAGWPAEQDAAPVAEIPVKPRPAQELLVCADGQVNLSFRSRPLLPLALEEFDEREEDARGLRCGELLRLDPDQANPRITEIAGGSSRIERPLSASTATRRATGAKRPVSRWPGAAGLAVVVVDPRGVAWRRPKLAVSGHDYADPLVGVEENIAYNAFLVGKSLLGMRVTDVLVAVRKIRRAAASLGRVVLCARRDAALVACFAAAVEPTIELVATEEMILSFRPLFDAEGSPINAASILPGLLQRFGDIAHVLAEIAPRRILIAAGVGDDLRDTLLVVPCPGDSVRIREY